MSFTWYTKRRPGPREFLRDSILFRALSPCRTSPCLTTRNRTKTNMARGISVLPSSLSPSFLSTCSDDRSRHTRIRTVWSAVLQSIPVIFPRRERVWEQHRRLGAQTDWAKAKAYDPRDVKGIRVGIVLSRICLPKRIRKCFSLKILKSQTHERPQARILCRLDAGERLGSRHAE